MNLIESGRKLICNMIYSPAKIKYHGLVGATCDLNSVLQVLFMTKNFREAVERYSCDTKGIDSNLKTLFDELKRQDTCTYNIGKQLGIKTVYEQRDAAECFEKILTSLTSPEASQIFQGQLTHKNKCCTCGNETTTDGPFWFLPLELVESDRKDYSVVDGIEKYFRASEISGENKMYCEKCDAKSNATMKCDINHHPEVLTVQLKRCKLGHSYNKHVKSECSVDIPYTLQIPKDQIYELYAFVEHTENLFSGNYTATIKSQDDENWYEFNNTRVTLLKKNPSFHEEDFQKSKSAYLLFYKKKTMHAADTLTQNTSDVFASGGVHQGNGDSSEQCQDAVKTKKRKEATASAASVRTYHGLKNQGATCYLNSVLQVLFMTKEFREAVGRYTRDSPTTKCIDHHLTTLFDKLEKNTADPYTITKELGINRVYEQRDAAECFEKILTSLTSPEASQIFQGQLTHKNKCSTCGNETNTDGPFWFLPLELIESDRKDYSVADGIEKYFRASEISGENEMYCEKCDAKSDATVQCEVKYHPEVLMLLLRRFAFNYSYMTYVKNNRVVDVPFILQLPDNQTYELYAVVDHIGDLRSGHYIATIKSQDNEKWYNFSDTWVSQLEYQIFQVDNNEKSRTAYLLYYRKHKSHAADTCTNNIREVSTTAGVPPVTTDNYDLSQDAEKISQRNEDEEKKEAANIEYHGVISCRKTSYLSCVLQVLFMTKDFREAVESLFRKTCESPDTGYLDRQLKDLFEDLKRCAASNCKITRKLGIDRVSEECEAADYFEMILSLTSPEASQIFHGKLTHKSICHRCSTEKAVDKPFQLLSLKLMESYIEDYRVVDGISEYFRDSQYIWPKYKMDCDKCDAKEIINVTKCEVKHHPEVLVLQLKRFEFNNVYKKYVKNNRIVDVPYTLQIPENKKYELYAVVNHVGDLRGGHFTATIKSQDNEKWYKFSDTRVTLLEDQRFQVDKIEKSKTACIIFYRKQKTANTRTQDVREMSNNGGFPPATTYNYEQRQDAVETKKKEQSEETAEVGNGTSEAASIDRGEVSVESSLSPHKGEKEKMGIHISDDRPEKTGADKTTSGRGTLETTAGLYSQGLLGDVRDGDRKRNMTKDDHGCKQGSSSTMHKGHDLRTVVSRDVNNDQEQKKGDAKHAEQEETTTTKPFLSKSVGDQDTRALEDVRQNRPEQEMSFTRTSNKDAGVEKETKEQEKKQNNEPFQIKEGPSHRQTSSEGIGSLHEEHRDTNKQSIIHGMIIEEEFKKTPSGFQKITVTKNIEIEKSSQRKSDPKIHKQDHLLDYFGRLKLNESEKHSTKRLFDGALTDENATKMQKLSDT